MGKSLHSKYKFNTFCLNLNNYNFDDLQVIRKLMNFNSFLTVFIVSELNRFRIFAV